MSTRGRRYVRPTYHEELVTDDDGSYYEEVVELPSTKRRPAASPRRVVRPAGYHHHSYGAPASDGGPEIVIENTLGVPQQPRARASSTGAAPQPQFLYVTNPPREKSRERTKHHYHHYSSESSDDDSSYRSSGRKHSRRRSSSRYDDDLAKKMAELELLKSQQYGYTRDKEEAAILARIEERKRQERRNEERMLLEYQEKQRQEELEQQKLLAEAEIKRLKKEAEMKAETDRLVAMQKDKAAREKAERERVIAEAKARALEEEREAKEERKRIIAEEEARKRKDKEEKEELRKRILAEEVDRKKKEKEKAEREEEEFQQKVKEKFMRAGMYRDFSRHSSITNNLLGYSPDYIEDILDEKKKKSALVRVGSRSRRNENMLLLESSRPTYIRVQVKHLSPETLEAYGLPWDYDPNDRKYILIKDYINHEFQQVLFEHTRKIRSEKLTITDGYVKDTVTTLKPRTGRTDEKFMVRHKSMSKSPARRSWMFT